MTRYSLVLRVQYDDVGRFSGQIVVPNNGQPIPFGSLSELWTCLLECLHLPTTGMLPATDPIADDQPRI